MASRSPRFPQYLIYLRALPHLYYWRSISPFLLRLTLVAFDWVLFCHEFQCSSHPKAFFNFKLPAFSLLKAPFCFISIISAFS
ncbi:hypothetical protein BT96DRAFT_85606 [Gymnopus androsaceus JB14]|uniref:Uncharacterized protein n=1 Tax=Gymnopus androsaceus JB14 TaxID=1447944 RepID=A0A6A4I733_9AGAR|nr:hypothetical protein BT96DRAFT_85606 [Gymnopus androsaceus JB14]